MVNMNSNAIRNTLMAIFTALYDILWKLNTKMAKLMNFLSVYVLNIFKKKKWFRFLNMFILNSLKNRIDRKKHDGQIVNYIIASTVHVLLICLVVIFAYYAKKM